MYLGPIETSTKLWIQNPKKTKEVWVETLSLQIEKTSSCLSVHHAPWKEFQLLVKIFIINSVKNDRLETRMEINEQFYCGVFIIETTFSLVKDHLGKSEHLIPFLSLGVNKV